MIKGVVACLLVMFPVVPREMTPVFLAPIPGCVSVGYMRGWAEHDAHPPLLVEYGVLERDPVGAVAVPSDVVIAVTYDRDTGDAKDVYLRRHPTAAIEIMPFAQIASVSLGPCDFIRDYWGVEA